jgi:hypothetical protein
MTLRAHRIVAAAAFAVAAAAAPITIALSAGAGQAVAAPRCLSWYGNQEDGVCLSYSNGNGVNVGSPFGVYGPNGSAGGINGPLLPGRTWNSPIA